MARGRAEAERNTEGLTARMRPWEGQEGEAPDPGGDKPWRGEKDPVLEVAEVTQ